MNKTYDAIVIGSGIIGCSIAFEMNKKGYRTVNVDKLASAGYGSTSNSCAIIRFHYSTPEGVAISRESYYYWLDWNDYLEVQDDRGMAKYVNTGCLVTKTEKNKNLKNVMACLADLGIAYEELDPSGIKAKFPFIDTQKYGPPVLSNDPRFGQPTDSTIKGAIYVPESGYISDPQLSTHNVQVASEAKGGKFLFNADVVDIRTKDNKVAGITLMDGTKLDAPIVVNVAGPHSYIINRMAGVEDGMNIKTRPLRQEVAHVPSPKDVNYETEGAIISDSDIGCYSRPEVGSHVLIGSEDPECDILEWVDDPDNYNKNFTNQWSTMVMREAQRVQELPIPNQMQGIVDLYDCTDDWIPIYDMSDLPGFYMAVGTSGNQYKNAPVVGLMMSELIEACEKGLDHDRAPYPFRLKHIGRTFNVGYYSRLREINPDSSFTVIG